MILGVGIAADTPAIRKEFAARGRALGPPGRPPPRDARRSARALWRRDGSASTGKHFTLDDVTMEPEARTGPADRPSGSAAAARPGLREAARFDGWFPTGPSVEFFAEHFPRIQAAAREAGRAPDAVTGAAYVTLALDAKPGRSRGAPAPVPRDVLRPPPLA